MDHREEVYTLALQVGDHQPHDVAAGRLDWEIHPRSDVAGLGHLGPPAAGRAHLAPVNAAWTTRSLQSR